MIDHCLIFLLRLRPVVCWMLSEHYGPMVQPSPSSLERWFIVSNITRNIAQQEMTSEDVCQDFSFNHNIIIILFDQGTWILDHEVYVVWE